ncbi:putative arabinogalactan protein [Cryptosporidium felis]|nr:putative arabinogalactan protein [Cryptosporidium felis]
MSINPELFSMRETGELVPSLLSGEYMMMSRKSVRFGLEDTNEKFKGHGDVFVTNKRLFLIKSKHTVTNRQSHFVSLCLPLPNIYTVEFKQPVILASYLEGFVKPCRNSVYPLSNDSKWWISFHNGGCATFVKLFYAIYLKAMKEGPLGSENENESSDGLEGINSNVAFIDKSDPTVIYIQES